MFLDLNGGCLVADLLEAIEVLFALTAGELTEKDLAMWIRWNMQNAE